jgi:hypothetical protein
MQVSSLLVLVMLLVALLCIAHKSIKSRSKEGMTGFGVISSLSMYNQPHHCWVSSVDGATYCATNSRIIL